MKLLRYVVLAVAVAGPSWALLAQSREPDIAGYYNERGDEFTKVTRSGGRVVQDTLAWSRKPD